MVQKRSVIEVDVQDWHVSKSFLGTEDETYREAFDWMNAVVLQYIEANDVDEEEAEYVAERAFHSITWEDSDFLCMYAVFEEDADEPIFGVYMTRAEAEEMIFTLCEEYTEEIINNDDPREVIGLPEWDIPQDYWYFMGENAKCFGIQVVPVFGVEEKLV